MGHKGKSSAQVGRKGSKGDRKHGRWIRKPSNAGYPRRRYRNKLKRVRQSNGAAAAQTYATTYNPSIRSVDPLAPRRPFSQNRH